MASFRPRVTIFHIVCTIAFLLLAIGFAAFWLRSLWTYDRYIYRADARHDYVVQSYRGVLFLQRNWIRFDRYDGPDVILPPPYHSGEIQFESGYREFGDGMDAIIWRKSGRLGFAYLEEPYVDGIGYCLVLPYWFLTVLSLAPMVWMGTGLLRRRRAPSGRCSHCSYDLRAHAVGQKCPECGMPIPAKNATIKPSERSYP